MSRKIKLELTEADWRALREVSENRAAVAQAAAPGDQDKQSGIAEALNRISAGILNALCEGMGDAVAAQSDAPSQKPRGRSM